MARTAIVLLLFLGLAMPAAADQDDPRLDRLFEQLYHAPDPVVARAVEHAIWNIWLSSDDDVINALMAEGVAAMQRRDYPAALRSFDSMVELAPDFAEGWNKRATLYYLMGAYQNSLNDIVRTLELEPRHFGALSGRGMILHDLGRNEEALTAFEAALDVNPQMPGARVNVEALRKLLEDSAI
ncbi:MAG: tetratricopeptide repeat protein [Kiloniellales bacterium]|nr:tetratricopeptide repeat protein [Kiloniellales bacterium]